MILEQDPGKVAINPDKFDKLIITALRMAVDNDGTLSLSYFLVQLTYALSQW